MINAFGYFMVSVIAYIINVFVMGGTMMLFSVPVTDSTILGIVVFTVVQGILAAIMHHNYIVEWRKVEATRLQEDGEYQRELLSYAKEENQHRQAELESKVNPYTESEIISKRHSESI